MDYMITKTIAEPTDAKGVNVVLTAVDPNGNQVTIGSVTSDQSGNFKKLWTPDVAGEYTIYAKFEGTQSYGPSAASTAVGVEAAHATTTPTTQSSVDNTYIIIGMGIAVIAVVAIVGLLVLRKK
jgi:hypothetical protein